MRTQMAGSSCFRGGTLFARGFKAKPRGNPPFWGSPNKDTPKWVARFDE